MIPLLSAAVPPCASDSSTFCGQVYDATKNAWLAGSANWLLTKPLKILMIIVIAFVVRLLVRRLINRVTTLPRGSGKLPALLRPLRERAPEVLGSAVIEVTDQPHTGCQKFLARFGPDALRFVNSPVGKSLHLRGINARVVRPGVIRVGDVARKIPGGDVRKR